LLSCQEYDAFLVTAIWVSQQSDSQTCVENLAFCTDWPASASSCSGIRPSIPILCFILEKSMVFCHRVRKLKKFLAIEANCSRNTLKLYVQLTKKPLKSTVTSNYFEAPCTRPLPKRGGKAHKYRGIADSQQCLQFPRKHRTARSGD